MKLEIDLQNINREYEILDKLLEYISGSFFVEKDDINLDESLVDAGIIDSIGLIKIITFIENEFSIVMENADMTKENLGSVAKMTAFIGRKIMERL